MDSLANYGSDDDYEENSVEKMGPFKSDPCQVWSTQADVNYDEVQMDLSEESNNNNSAEDDSSPRPNRPSDRKRSYRSRSRDDSRPKAGRPRPQRPEDRECNAKNDERTRKYAAKGSAHHEDRPERSKYEREGQSGHDDRKYTRNGALQLGNRQKHSRDGPVQTEDRQKYSRDGALAAEDRQKYSRDGALAAEDRQKYNRDSALATEDRHKYNRDGAVQTEDRHKYNRDGPSQADDKHKYNRDSQGSAEERADRLKHGKDEKNKNRDDRSRKARAGSKERVRSSSRDRRRSGSRERKRSRSPRRNDHKNGANGKDRGSNSRGYGKRFDRTSNKMAQLEKLGIEIKTPDAEFVTPQMLLQRSMDEQVQKIKNSTGIELPKYYNPAAMNPARYADQIQKRRLLWQKKDPEAKVVAATAGVAGSKVWEQTTFAQDQDGKVASKFKRLMGIKENPTSAAGGGGKDILKKQEEMFSSMEQQYEDWAM